LHSTAISAYDESEVTIPIITSCKKSFGLGLSQMTRKRFGTIIITIFLTVCLLACNPIPNATKATAFHFALLGRTIQGVVKRFKRL